MKTHVLLTKTGPGADDDWTEPLSLNIQRIDEVRFYQGFGACKAKACVLMKNGIVHHVVETVGQVQAAMEN